MGYILLAGGAEFGGKMSEPDRRAMDLAGGVAASIRIIPAAAAPDNNHARAGQNGVNWFKSLGAKNVQVTSLIDAQSANQPGVVQELEAARLIYLLGGFPGHLVNSLVNTPAWQAILKALDSGAVLAGSSAGAMALCEHVYDPYQSRLIPGLNLLPATVVLPHHNSFGQGWAAGLRERLSGARLVGIDERTGILNDAPGAKWRVYGQGTATLYENGGRRSFLAGEEFSLT